MLNGKVIEAESYNIGDMFVTYKKTGDTRSTPRAVDKYDVFSVQRADGGEEVVYAPDSMDFTVEEARAYIKGEQAARIYYKKPANAWSSALVGAGSSILSFYSLPVPMIYSVVLGRFNPKHMQIPEGYDADVSQTEPYLMGYQKAARNMKIQQSLKWGYISLGVGLTTLIIYGAANND